MISQGSAAKTSEPFYLRCMHSTRKGGGTAASCRVVLCAGHIALALCESGKGRDSIKHNSGHGVKQVCKPINVRGMVHIQNGITNV